MSLLTKVQTLLHKWFPNKEDDKENFEEWFDNSISYTNGVLEIEVD